MAGLRGNVASWAFGIQSAKGTPATEPDVWTPFSGGSIQPARTIDQLSETDATREQGQSFVQQTGTEGSPELYFRPEIAHLVLEAALGDIGTTGVGPFVHTVQPAEVLPYYTIWRSQADTLWEQFVDCKASELSISADAGNPLTATINWLGRSATRLTTDPALLPWTATLQTGLPFNYNDAAVTLGGAATSLISSFDLSITNNASVQQTDDAVPYDVVEGQFEVTLGFDLIFETLAEYNKFHYGGAAGTTQDDTIFTTDANFTFTLGTDIVAFDFDSIAYEEFPVDPDPGGDPIVVPVRARSQRSASPFVVATVTNDTAGA